MPVSSLSFTLFRFLLPPALISLLWLYFYAPLHDCAFPQVVAARSACHAPGSNIPAVQAKAAPFRLLVLADPQLEGDTSLPDPNAPSFPSLLNWRQRAREHGLRAVLGDVVPTVRQAYTQDLPRVLQAYRKRLDLLGNDYYLAHVYRSVKRWTRPTHMVVLGDLLGSQWIDDDEFEERARRFWQRVFRGARPAGLASSARPGRRETLSETAWADQLIAVAGNHDIGYAGDINGHRIERFEAAFGQVNWQISFDLPREDGHRSANTLASSGPALKLIVLNSMNLDEPAADTQLRNESWGFLHKALEHNALTNAQTGTILLTHVPLHKEVGVCVDSPLINLFPPENGGGIREQNHLTPETSSHILSNLGSQSIILNGHDHEGCDVLHSRTDANADDGQQWSAQRLPHRPSRSSTLLSGSIREVTVRSMMGSFGGNAGFLSAWYEDDDGQPGWHFEYSSCMLGVQHYWWAVHVLSLIELGLLGAWVASLSMTSATRAPVKQK